ncbi:hypothetical protein C8Q70DRAFT_56275 [Cubamyces menziesii]|nr:hypothetical protein C8Q70DRAFT_56275 [Cubamyces menziesii]
MVEGEEKEHIGRAEREAGWGLAGREREGWIWTRDCLCPGTTKHQKSKLPANPVPRPIRTLSSPLWSPYAPPGCCVPLDMARLVPRHHALCHPAHPPRPFTPPRGVPQPLPRLLPACILSCDRYRPPLPACAYATDPTCDTNGLAPPNEPSTLVVSEHAWLVWAIVDPVVEVTGTTACFDTLTTSISCPVTGRKTHHIEGACAPSVLGSSVARRVLASVPSGRASARPATGLSLSCSCIQAELMPLYHARPG